MGAEVDFFKIMISFALPFGRVAITPALLSTLTYPDPKTILHLSLANCVLHPVCLREGGKDNAVRKEDNVDNDTCLTKGSNYTVRGIVDNEKELTGNNGTLGMEAIGSADSACAMIDKLVVLDNSATLASDKQKTTDVPISSLREFMAALTFLNSIDMNDCIASLCEADGLETMRLVAEILPVKDALAIKPRIDRLVTSANAMGKKGVSALQRLICASLKELVMENDGLDEQALQLVNELLKFDEYGKLVPETKLRSICVSRNYLLTGGAIALGEIFSRSPLLEEVVVSGTRIPSDGCLVLARGMLNLKNLKVLNVSDNCFGNKISAVHNFAAVIKNNIGLTSLNVYALSLESEGVKILSNAIESSQLQLEFLNLGGNDFESRTCKHVAKMISSQRSLKHLILEENQIRDKGVALIFSALEQLAFLEILNVSSTQLATSAVQPLRVFLKNSAAIQTGTFKHFIANENFLTDSQIEQFTTHAFVTFSFEGNDPEAYDEEEEEEESTSDSDKELVETIEQLTI